MKEFRIEVWPEEYDISEAAKAIGLGQQVVRVQKKVIRGWFKKREVWEYVREFRSEGYGPPFEFKSVEHAKRWIDKTLNPPKPEYIKYP